MESKNVNLPSMPIGTAVWLIDNTSLTFKQIANFCGIHELEIKGIADGDVAQGILGSNPITKGELTKQEIERCTKDSTQFLCIIKKLSFDNLLVKKKLQTKYTPIARRQDKPDAVYWLLKNCPEIQDQQIIKLIGTTKSTIEAIKQKTHWNIKNIRPRDPVLLGICSQSELNIIMDKYSSSL